MLRTDGQTDRRTDGGDYIGPEAGPKRKYVNKLKSPDIDLLKLSRNKLKENIKEHILSKYED